MAAPLGANSAKIANMEVINQIPTTKPTRHVSLLVDSCPVKLQLVEDADKSGKVVVRGEFAKCGIATENKRVYPNKLWEREIQRLNKAMQERRLYGLLDHPTNGRTELANASHIITNLEIKNGVVYGEAEVLNTTKGRELKGILEASGFCGISSRGMGSVRTNEKGEDVVQDDYRLMTFDFVADPADQSALPKVFYEHDEGSMERDQELAAEFAKKLEAAKKEGAQGAEVSLREEFTKQVLTMMAELRSTVAEDVRGELLSDPAVAGAKTALDQIKSVLRPFVLPEDAKTVTEQKDTEIAALKNQLAELNLKIKDQEVETQKLEAVAKSAGYKYFLERQVSGDPDAELIRKLIGDVTQYETSDVLKERIEAVRKDLSEKRQAAHKLAEQIESDRTKEQERKEKERIRALEQEKSLRTEVDKLTEALESALEANKQFSLVHYADTRLQNHPRATQIRPLIEAANLDSQEDVDAIIQKFREPVKDSEQLETVRSRVRQSTHGGTAPSPIEEADGSAFTSNAQPNDRLFNQLGVSTAQLRELSGLPPSTRNRQSH